MIDLNRRDVEYWLTIIGEPAAVERWDELVKVDPLGAGDLFDAYANANGTMYLSVEEGRVWSVTFTDSATFRSRQLIGVPVEHVSGLFSASPEVEPWEGLEGEKYQIWSYPDGVELSLRSDLEGVPVESVRVGEPMVEEEEDA